jgi:hypothetical protein
MSKDKISGSMQESMPAPQLPNIPISPDDPFQVDPEQLPPVAPASDQDPAPNPQTPGRMSTSPPGRDEPPICDDRPDREDRKTAEQA